MCSTRQIISPSGSLFNKNRKYVDPLGLTNTAIGDPTGRIRKEHAAVKKENAEAPRLGEYGYNRITTALGAEPAYGPSAAAAPAAQPPKSGGPWSSWLQRSVAGAVDSAKRRRTALGGGG